ncbi:MAG: hypothetical protein KDC84_14590 [Crocinitomicaceae bacterium]|nr:hypothetical protein [Crocinitomicaceae bacterium]
MHRKDTIVDDIDLGFCEDCGTEISSNFKRCFSCHQKSIGKNNFKHKESEGEEYIAQYLDLIGLQYNKQVEIHNLKYDEKQFRVADFKIPSLSLYIEYDGYWHLDKDKDMDKKEIYDKNNIPCVYLYPENLGALEFFLDKRIQKTLKYYNRHKELNRYFWFKFRKGEIERLLFISFFLFLSILGFSDPQTNSLVFQVLMYSGVAYQTWRLITAYRKIFIHNKYPLPVK